MAAPMPVIAVLRTNVKMCSYLSLARRQVLANSIVPCTITCRHVSAGTGEKSVSRRSAPDDVGGWKKLDWQSYAKGNVRVPVSVDEKFPVLLIPGHSSLPHKLEKREKAARRPRKKIPPRYKSMSTDQDWTNVWPSASSFKWSVVPFPVRQGVVRRSENQGIPPGKYANAELMKIPNFLHLTPAHVKNHCAAIKKFCTEWPKALNNDEACRKHFPIEITSCDYVMDTPDLRDPRARFVTLKVKLSDLKLDEHAKDKFLKLVGDRYNEETDTLTLEADRCPLKKQNRDYTVYLLTALYNESWKTETWETDETEADMRNFEWDLTAARTALINHVNRIKDMEKSKEVELPDAMKELKSADEQSLESLEVTKQYRDALRMIHDQGENAYNQNKYKEATKKLLLGLS